MRHMVMSMHGGATERANLQVGRRSRRGERTLPCPVPRPGPIHGMGRAARYRASPSRVRRALCASAEDEDCSNIARTFVAGPAQAGEVKSARGADHNDMRFMRHRNRKVERTHPTGLVEPFERALQGVSHPPFFPHDARQLARDHIAVPDAEMNLPPDIRRPCHLAIRVTLRKTLAA